MLVENRQFEPSPPLFGAPVGMTPLKFRRKFLHQKTRVRGLSYHNTDRPTDGWTHDDSVYRVSSVAR